jgi:putative transposase
MARLPRIVLSGIAHHVTQRGNRRQRVFFGDDDYAHYIDLMAEAAVRSGTEIWAYCLMPNHVHMIVVPQNEDGLRALFAEAHRRYTRTINARHRWTGHLWQGRYGSVAMDDAHVFHALRYVALNPVAAKLVAQAGDWRWSSAAAHLAGRDDALVKVAPVLARTGDFAAFLGESDARAATRDFAAIAKAAVTGRPIGDATWIDAMEARTGRRLRPAKRGPQPRDK